MIMIIMMILNLGGIFGMAEAALMWISLALTIISLLDYVMKNKQVLTQGGM